MVRTFEELAGPELNKLYRGALFLTAGDEDAAEDLLVATLTGAFLRTARVPAEESPRWLEGELASTFVGGLDPAGAHRPRPLPRRGVPPGEAMEELGAEALFAAAGRVPPRPRAALWLVMLQRWEYGEAAMLLGIDRERLLELLRHRDTLVSGVMRGPRARDGQSRMGHEA